MQKKVMASLLGSLLIGGLALYFTVLALVTLTDRLTLLSNGVTVTGKVVSVDGNDESYFPTISFQTTDGKTAQFTTNTNSTYKEKEQVPVIYRSDNPQEAYVNNFGALWVATVFQVVAAILFAVGSIVPIRSFLSKRWWFRHQRVMAQLERVQEVTDPASTSYRVTSVWNEPTTGRAYTFQSDELDFDPRPVLNATHEVAVDINPRNPAHYYVDQQSLKQSHNSKMGSTAQV